MGGVDMTRMEILTLNMLVKLPSWVGEVIIWLRRQNHHIHRLEVLKDGKKRRLFGDCFVEIITI